MCCSILTRVCSSVGYVHSLFLLFIVFEMFAVRDCLLLEVLALYSYIYTASSESNCVKLKLESHPLDSCSNWSRTNFHWALQQDSCWLSPQAAAWWFMQLYFGQSSCWPYQRIVDEQLVIDDVCAVFGQHIKFYVLHAAVPVASSVIHFCVVLLNFW